MTYLSPTTTTAGSGGDGFCAAGAAKPGPTPMFDAVVGHVCNYDLEVIKWFWAYVGAALIGRPPGVALALVGGGGNGRGTVARILGATLGGDALETDRRIFSKRSGPDELACLADLDGRRLVVVDHIENSILNVARLTALTTGEPVPVKRIRGRPAMMTPTFSLLLLANESIRVAPRDLEEFGQRIRVIRCRRRIPESQRENGLDNKIVAAEGPAILARLQAEARAVEALRGLPPAPPAVVRMTSETLALAAGGGQ